MQVLQEIKNMAVHTQLVFWLMKYKLCLLFGSALCNMYKFMSIMSSVLEKDWNTLLGQDWGQPLPGYIELC